MKKIFSALLCSVIVCVCALSACTVKAPVEQINNMTVKSVAQSANGSINVMLDVSEVDFSAEREGSEKYYYIEPSLDGGMSWLDRSVYLTQSEVENGEFSFNLAEYSSYDGSYYLLGSQDEASRLNLSAGDKIELSLRFKAYENYLASNATQSVDYVIKSLTEVEIYASSVDGNPPSVGGTQYVFVKQQNESFKLFRISDAESVFGEAEAEVTDRLEYKFISENDLETIGDMTILNSGLKELENSSQTSGWIAYSSENGITSSDYEGKLIDKVDRFSTYDPESGAEIGYTEFVYEYALAMVRLKGTETELKSEVALVYLYLKNNINEYFYD